MPLAETAALAAVCRWVRRTRSFRQSVDLYFAGHGPWLFWSVGLCANWSFVLPVQAFVITRFGCTIAISGGPAIPPEVAAQLGTRFGP